MALNQFKTEFYVSKPQLNVVICIYHVLGTGTESRVNEMLEYLQRKLRQECSKFSKIQVAYVYETPLLDVKPFRTLEKETPFYYKEPCRKSETHSLSRVWFMGLALLEQQQRNNKERTEQRLYLITDEKFDRVQVNEIVEKRDGKLYLNPRFSAVEFTPILMKTEKAGGDNLEEYIQEKGDRQIF